MIRFFVMLLIMCIISIEMLLSQPEEHQDLKWAIQSNFTYTVKFTNDGKNLISAAIDEKPKIWDVESGQMIKQYHGMNVGIMKLDVSKDDRYIAAVNDLGEITIWNLYEGDIVKKITDFSKSTKKYNGNNIFFSNNCEYLISKLTIANNEGTTNWLAIWSTKNWELIKKVEIRGYSIALSKNDSLIAFANDLHSIEKGYLCIGIYEFPSLNKVAETKPNESRNVLFSPDGKYLISQSFSGYRKWNTKDWSLAGTYGLYDDTDFGYAISPDGNYLIGFAFWSKFSVVIDLNDGQIFNVYKNNYIYNESTTCLSYDISNDMKYIAVGAWNGVYVLNSRWDITSVKDKQFGNSSLFSIYPNPASDYITIQFYKGLKPFVTVDSPSNKELQLFASDKVQIFDVLGIEVCQSSLIDITTHNNSQSGMIDLLKIDVTYLPAGMYFIRFGNMVEKFVKM